MSVISPEKDNYLQQLSIEESKTVKDPQERHYMSIKKSIELADAIVIESSFQDFQIGFEADFAVENKKYVLVLSQFEDFSTKIRHPYFKGAQYSEVTIDNIVESFLNMAEKNQFSERFNFFLSPTQQQFLKTQAEKVGVNQSEYLRLLIDQKKYENE